MTDTQDWREEALCAQVGGDLWFPGKGESYTEAKRVCAICPVQESCLEDALNRSNDDDHYGFQGGVGPITRRRLRAQRREAA